MCISVVERRACDQKLSRGFEYRRQGIFFSDFLLQGQLSVLMFSKVISVSVLHPCYRSSTWEIPVILPNLRVGYSNSCTQRVCRYIVTHSTETATINPCILSLICSCAQTMFQKTAGVVMVDRRSAITPSALSMLFVQASPTRGVMYKWIF